MRAFLVAGYRPVSLRVTAHLPPSPCLTHTKKLSSSTPDSVPRRGAVLDERGRESILPWGRLRVKPSSTSPRWQALDLAYSPDLNPDKILCKSMDLKAQTMDESETRGRTLRRGPARSTVRQVASEAESKTTRPSLLPFTNRIGTNSSTTGLREFKPELDSAIVDDARSMPSAASIISRSATNTSPFENKGSYSASPSWTRPPSLSLPASPLKTPTVTPVDESSFLSASNLVAIPAALPPVFLTGSRCVIQPGIGVPVASRGELLSRADLTPSVMPLRRRAADCPIPPQPSPSPRWSTATHTPTASLHENPFQGSCTIISRGEPSGSRRKSAYNTLHGTSHPQEVVEDQPGATSLPFSLVRLPKERQTAPSPILSANFNDLHGLDEGSTKSLHALMVRRSAQISRPFEHAPLPTTVEQPAIHQGHRTLQGCSHRIFVSSDLSMSPFTATAVSSPPTTIINPARAVNLALARHPLPVAIDEPTLIDEIDEIFKALCAEPSPGQAELEAARDYYLMVFSPPSSSAGIKDSFSPIRRKLVCSARPGILLRLLIFFNRSSGVEPFTLFGLVRPLFDDLPCLPESFNPKLGHVILGSIIKEVRHYSLVLPLIQATYHHLPHDSVPVRSLLSTFCRAAFLEPTRPPIDDLIKLIQPFLVTGVRIEDTLHKIDTYVVLLAKQLSEQSKGLGMSGRTAPWFRAAQDSAFADLARIEALVREHAMSSVGTRFLTSLLVGYSFSGRFELVYRIWEEMRAPGGPGADERTVAAFFDACGWSDNLAVAEQVWNDLRTDGSPIYLNTFDSYNECLFRCGAWNRAVQLIIEERVNPSKDAIREGYPNVESLAILLRAALSFSKTTRVPSWMSRRFRDKVPDLWAPALRAITLRVPLDVASKKAARGLIPRPVKARDPPRHQPGMESDPARRGSHLFRRHSRPATVHHLSPRLARASESLCHSSKYRRHSR